jgi:hypothetical protein
MINLIIKFVNNLNYNVLIKNNLLVVMLTLFFLPFPNKSNISAYIILPVITSLQCKYLLGDLDKGFQWSLTDIVYWVSLVGFSIVTIWIYKKLFDKQKK